jgi:hypothetical protein
MRMGGGFILPPTIQSRTLHFVPSDQCAGPPITVKRPIRRFKARRGRIFFRRLNVGNSQMRKISKSSCRRNESPGRLFGTCLAARFRYCGISAKPRCPLIKCHNIIR